MRGGGSTVHRLALREEQGGGGQRESRNYSLREHDFSLLVLKCIFLNSLMIRGHVHLGSVVMETWLNDCYLGRPLNPSIHLSQGTELKSQILDVVNINLDCKNVVISGQKWCHCQWIFSSNELAKSLSFSSES